MANYGKLQRAKRPTVRMRASGPSAPPIAKVQGAVRQQMAPAAKQYAARARRAYSQAAK
jgi:hypothetical protein